MPRAYKQAKKKPFLQAFSRIGTIIRAAEAVRIDPSTVYEWLKADEEFQNAFNAVNNEVTERLEDIAIDKAMRGDNTMLIFLLKSRAPEKYMERFRHEVQNEQLGRLIGLVTSILKRRLTQDQIEELMPEFDAAINTLDTRKQALEMIA
ncbi:MAG: hypothetical protein DMF62_02515 [Acidobacteria bacterium]|nr:MAG: hypothetical protein DMF62_02515 [Acidobacteriota bacterium]